MQLAFVFLDSSAIQMQSTIFKFQNYTDSLNTVSSLLTITINYSCLIKFHDVRRNKVFVPKYVEKY